MTNSKNPNHAPQTQTADTRTKQKDAKPFLADIPIAIWLLWGVSLLGIPSLMFFEESMVENSDDQFRLGWLHSLPNIFALTISLLAPGSLFHKFGYFFCTLACIVATIIAAAIIMLSIFGMSGVQ